MSSDTAMVKSEAALDLSAYQPMQYNVLNPVVRMDSAAEYLRFRAVEVRLDPDPDHSDCYPAPGGSGHYTDPKNSKGWIPDKVCPAKAGLLKIASAAGLVLDPHNSRRIRPEACERCIEAVRASKQAVRCGDCPSRFDMAYQAIGAVRGATGEWVIRKATYEWNLDAQERKIRREARKRKKTGAGFDAYVEDRLDQVLSERAGLAETKALLRLIRAICAVGHTYTREDIAKPFVVVRAEVDYDHPALRQVMMQRALESGADLFGQGRADAPSVTLREIAASTEGLTELAGEPDFTDAESKAEEVAAVAENGEPGDTEPPDEEPHEPFGDDGDGSGEAQPELPMDEPDEDVVYCKDCGNSLTNAVLAYCQSERGREEFGGANFCFDCQKAVREKTKTATKRGKASDHRPLR